MVVSGNFKVTKYNMTRETNRFSRAWSNSRYSFVYPCYKIDPWALYFLKFVKNIQERHKNIICM